MFNVALQLCTRDLCSLNDILSFRLHQLINEVLRVGVGTILLVEGVTDS